MADPIQLQIVNSPVPPITPPVMANSRLSSEQIQALISLIASANPALLVLPNGKSFSDIKGFNVRVLSDGSGAINVIF